MSLFDQIVENDVPHWIGGEGRRFGGEYDFKNYCSSNGRVINKIAAGGAEAIDAAVHASQKGLKDSGWAHISFRERAEVVLKLANLIEENNFELARLESLDTGKPLSETKSGDIPRSAQNFRFFAELCQQENPEVYESQDGSHHQTFREPIGIVGLITPWNLPLYLESWKIAPALMCGNAVILKPAELTPLTAYALALLAKKAGLPDGLLNVVQGYGPNAAGEELVKHPEVPAISFTGETTTGAAIAATSANLLKRLSFELGGKGATVVCRSADLEKAAASIRWAAFRNQGQICLAGSRLIVHQDVKDELLKILIGHVNEIKIGDPLDENTTMGSLICKEHRDKVMGYVKYARDTELDIVTGGEVPAGLESGAFLQPTIVDKVPQNSRLIKEEIFGPVLTVQTFENDETALMMLNGTRYGLSCSIWSQEEQQMNRLTAEARTGLVWQNSWFLRNLNTAFGGMKDSGVGREGGRHSLNFYSELKTVSSPKK